MGLLGSWSGKKQGVFYLWVMGAKRASSEVG